ncbi:2Fe-2S iron-sulfur cluster-binding protein [Ideonella azotifigens]|uniref:2Fe-2S iron-sulfur cluster-binding protein n=1 Tax=Ideonella azotifigens TaxID=513160 RepID=A0ABP3VV34_9BURK|nr:2Fe-2S iron-sulfur cluster-binding protein [Ideonella azotifigens]MCD2339356.1 2Fe-2S iron-sulfur cluster-binding protein [Ideonella azotifigens]
MSSEASPPTADAPSARWLEIQPQGWRLPLPPGLSLLEAAQQAGVRLARSCRNGTCRACRCQLLAGEVRYRVEWPGISAEERAEGLILPCVAEPLGDVRIEAPAAQKL